MDKTLGELVRETEQNFISGTGTLMSKYVTTDLYEDINTIYAYLNSKHISGEKDAMGRDKPFFNIVIASRNIWYRATDKDRKDIRLRSKKAKDTIGSYMMNALLQDWMTKEKFGKFLNNWGLVQAGFNSAILKFVEKDGRLISSVVPWSKIICDQVDFANNPKIELLELTEAQLYERGYNKEQVKALCDTAKTRELTNKQKKDNKDGYYKLYEVHGKLPLSYITGNEKDENTFVQQMHVISFVGKRNGRKTEYDDFTLYKGREEKDPYMLTALLPSDDGSISLDGAVKNLFQAQWMMNHTKKAIKDQLDLASKLIFQTSDGNYAGQNALSAIESGDIMIHAVNQPLTQIANNSHDVTALMNFGGEWKQLSSEINGISDAMLGVAPKAGTAWRQVEATLQENYNLFELMGENKMLDLEDIIRDRVLPFLKKKMNNKDEIVALLGDYGIDKIEKKYIEVKGAENFNKKLYESIISKEKIPTDLSYEGEMSKVQNSLQEQGEVRFIKPSEIDDTTWKDLLKDVEVDVEIISEENSNTQEALQTIDKMLGIIVNPMYANNKKAQFLVNKGLELTGYLSPAELSGIEEPKPVAPVGGGSANGMELLNNQK